ncbi:hypothetical protein ONZ45_g17111 [Pleurotus djamor]|nr:hypothetical protein ONZ45_g17111 [Pleurotus djamor]
MMRVTTNFESQHSIDREIAAHEKAIIALKTRRNTHAAISKLPDDVMLMIFSLAKPTEKLPEIVAWLRKTQRVCSQWKEMILNSPRLWSDIILNRRPSYLATATMMLARAKGAPLDVTVSRLSSSERHDEQFWEVIKSVLDQINHIKTLDITSTTLMDRITSLLPESAPAPLLRDLRLSGYTYDDSRNDTPLTIFKHLHHLHSLRQLVIAYVRVPEELPFLPTLRELTLISPATQVDFGVTMSWLLTALKSTPNLHHLYVREVLTNKPMHTIQTSHVNLLSLKRLELTLTDLRQSVIFDHLNFPTSTLITTSIKLQHQGDLLTKHLTPLSTLTTRILADANISSTPYAVSIRLPKGLFVETTDGHHVLNINLPEPGSEQHASEYIHFFASVSPYLKRISLSVLPFASIFPPIPELLHRLHKLKTITLPSEPDRCLRLLRALSKGPNGNPPPCPGLEYFEFPFPTFPYPYADEETVTAMEEVIAGRREYNMPIKKIFLLKDGVRGWEARFKYPELLEGVFEPK